MRLRIMTASRRLLYALLLGLLASSPAIAESVLRSGHPGEPDSLDPHLAVAAPALVVINDLFESLLTLDARGKPIAGAAASYSLSDDQRTYSFTLRPNLLWSDGRVITADDFVYSIRRLADPATAATTLAGFVDLFANGRAVLSGQLPPSALGVAAPDSRTVRITLAQPTPYFPTVIALPVFAPVPRHLIETVGQGWTRPGVMVSNGPFVLEAWRPGDQVRVRRNPRFHAAASVRLDGVIYRPIIDLNAGLRMFLAGDLDVMTNFPPERLDSLRQQRPGELRLSPSLGVTVYVINHRNPKLQDARVRQALSLAIDRDLLTTRVIRSGDRSAWSLVPPGMAGYGELLSAPPGSAAQRVARARQLLSDAGYSMARPLDVELLYHSSEEHKRVAVAVTAMWQDIGVRASLRNAERQVVEVSARAGDFEIVRAAWFSTYADPMGLLQFLQTGSPANAGGYANAAFQQALDQATRLTDPTARLRALRSAEQLAMQDQAVIPLYFMVSRRLVSRRVIGWRDDNLTALRGARWLAVR